jgi:hypothetical protein
MAEGELDTLAHELAGAEALEASLGAGVAAMLAKASETEATVGLCRLVMSAVRRTTSCSARSVRRRGAERIRQQIAWRRKALKG